MLQGPTLHNPQNLDADCLNASWDIDQLKCKLLDRWAQPSQDTLNRAINQQLKDWQVIKARVAILNFVWILILCKLRKEYLISLTSKFYTFFWTKTLTYRTPYHELLQSYQLSKNSPVLAHPVLQFINAAYCYWRSVVCLSACSSDMLAISHRKTAEQSRCRLDVDSC